MGSDDARAIRRRDVPGKAAFGKVMRVLQR